MDMQFKTFEEMLELMDSKVVQTEQGSFIRVDDLRSLNEELGRARVAQRERDAAPKPTGFEAAKAAALQDPEFTKLFEKKPPQAPAVARDTNVATEEKVDEPVTA
jgi:hypothetical protein